MTLWIVFCSHPESLLPTAPPNRVAGRMLVNGNSSFLRVDLCPVQLQKQHVATWTLPGAKEGPESCFNSHEVSGRAMLTSCFIFRYVYPRWQEEDAQNKRVLFKRADPLNYKEKRECYSASSDCILISQVYRIVAKQCLLFGKN